jgi:hypothetical protein
VEGWVEPIFDESVEFGADEGFVIRSRIQRSGEFEGGTTDGPSLSWLVLL